ncbi:hypothetical protein EHM76_04845, partial [bacterium]
MSRARLVGVNAAPSTERAWQEQVLTIARYYGWWTYHTYDARRSEPGFPDLVLIRPPRLMMVELKTNTGRVTKAQQAVLDLLNECRSPEAY